LNNQIPLNPKINPKIKKIKKIKNEKSPF
jgi:hypothetical protein